MNIPGLTPNNRHPVIESIKAGDTIAIFNLTREKPKGSYNETILTTIYMVSGEEISTKAVVNN